jgi:hypothetical protein
VQLEGLDKSIKIINFIGSRNRDLPACRRSSSPTMLPRDRTMDVTTTAVDTLMYRHHKPTEPIRRVHLTGSGVSSSWEEHPVQMKTETEPSTTKKQSQLTN